MEYYGDRTRYAKDKNNLKASHRIVPLRDGPILLEIRGIKMRYNLCKSYYDVSFLNFSLFHEFDESSAHTNFSQHCNMIRISSVSTGWLEVRLGGLGVEDMVKKTKVGISHVYARLS